MNKWCMWRAEQFRKDGDGASAARWTARADSEPSPNPEFRWPNGFNRGTAVARVQKFAHPGMPDDASDFWVLGALNELLDSPRADSIPPAGGGSGYNPYRNHGKFAPGPHADRRKTEHDQGHADPNNLSHHEAALNMSKAAHAKSESAHALGRTSEAAQAHRDAGNAHRDAASAHEALGNKEIAKAHWTANGEHHDKADYLQAHAKATAATATANAAGTAAAHNEAYSAHQKIVDRYARGASPEEIAGHKAAASSHFDTADKIRGPREPSKYR